jgi:hypothetical protein
VLLIDRVREIAAGPVGNRGSGDRMDTRFAARVLSVLMRMRRREQFTADQLGRFQNSELRRLRDHAHALSPF